MREVENRAERFACCHEPLIFSDERQLFFPGRGGSTDWTRIARITMRQKKVSGMTRKPFS
jgi:hypothetical protein